MRATLKFLLSYLTPKQVDEVMVQRAATQMVARMDEKRTTGAGGWHGERCSNQDLLQRLHRNVQQGDMTNVMNLAGMIDMRSDLYGEPTVLLQAPEASSSRAQRIIKLDASGNELPDDSRDFAILQHGPAGLLIDVRKLHRGSHESCTRFAGESTLLGRKWRLGTVEELFLHVADRTRQSPAVNPDLYPMLGKDWIWSSTPDAKPDNPSSPVYAWGVGLSYGGASIVNRRDVGLALPVSPLAASASQ